jgi:hypothetical protein
MTAYRLLIRGSWVRNPPGSPILSKTYMYANLRIPDVPRSVSVLCPSKKVRRCAAELCHSTPLAGESKRKTRARKQS